MENIELKEKYESLNEDQRKYFILKTCLESENLKKTIETIMEFEKDFYKKYIKEVSVGMFAEVYKKEVKKTEKYFQDSKYYHDDINKDIVNISNSVDYYKHNKRKILKLEK